MQYIQTREKCLGADQNSRRKARCLANLAALGLWSDPQPHANQAILYVLAALDSLVSGSPLTAIDYVVFQFSLLGDRLFMSGGNTGIHMMKTLLLAVL